MISAFLEFRRARARAGVARRARSLLCVWRFKELAFVFIRAFSRVPREKSVFTDIAVMPVIAIFLVRVIEHQVY